VASSCGSGTDWWPMKEHFTLMEYVMCDAVDEYESMYDMM